MHDITVAMHRNIHLQWCLEESLMHMHMLLSHVHIQSQMHLHMHACAYTHKGYILNAIHGGIAALDTFLLTVI